MADTNIAPARVHSQSCISQSELNEFGIALRECNVSDRTRKLFVKHAVLPPHVRLAVNLKIILGRLVLHDHIPNVLDQGLLPEERTALLELEAKVLPVHWKAIAHGLLNIHERWLFLKTLRNVFKDAKRYSGTELDFERSSLDG